MTNDTTPNMAAEQAHLGDIPATAQPNEANNASHNNNTTASPEGASGTSRAELKEKLAQFVFYFVARHDVYALRQPALKQGKKATYTPKRKPLTHDILREDHFIGKDYQIGTYLVLPDGTTVVAAFDLDDHDGSLPWDDIVAHAAKICARAIEHGLVPNIFSSGSGHGIHIWFLWENPQSAADVISLLEDILKECAYNKGSDGLAKNEVELFPKQKKIPEGGLGNLIGLPLA